MVTERAVIIDPCLQIPVLSPSVRLLVGKRSVGSCREEDMSLVEIRVCLRQKAIGIEIGLVIYSLGLDSVTGTCRVDKEVVVICALDSYAETLCEHIDALSYVNVKVVLGVVGLLIAIAVEHEHTVAEHFSERHEVLRDNGPDSVNEARS